MTLNHLPVVLYLDDDEANLNSFRANFRDVFKIRTAKNPIDAYNILKDEKINIVITDQKMPSMSGVEFLETIARDFPQIQRILLTGFAEWQSVVDAVNRGEVFRIITKPFNVKEIKKMILEAMENFKSALEKDNLINSLKKQNQQFEFILRQKLLT